MFKVAIVAALEREVQPLVKHWHLREREHDGRRFRFFEREDTVLVCGGIGGDAARRTTEAVILLYGPNVVYSAGYAGALDPGLKVGDIVRPARVMNAADGSSVSIAGGEGVLVSYGVVASPAQKTKLRESFQARAVDMESAAVARAAEARGVAFGVVKVISDEFDFEFPATERFMDSAGRFQETRFALFAAVRPWLWPRVLRLATNSRRATRALCDHLLELVDSESAVPQ